jgi:hypothetical protein
MKKERYTRNDLVGIRNAQRATISNRVAQSVAISHRRGGFCIGQRIAFFSEPHCSRHFIKAFRPNLSAAPKHMPGLKVGEQEFLIAAESRCTKYACVITNNDAGQYRSVFCSDHKVSWFLS